MEELVLGLIMKDELVNFFEELAEPQRSSEIRRLAGKHDFTYQKSEGIERQDFELLDFSLFGKKRWVKLFKRLLIGKETTPECYTRIYDYISNNELETQKTTVVELDCEQLNTPKFKISPKGSFKRMKEAFVSNDLPYPSLSEFHSKYEIQCDMPEELEFILPKSFLQLLSKQKGLTVEAEGQLLLLYKRKKLFKPHQIMDSYNLALDLLEALLSDRSNQFV